MTCEEAIKLMDGYLDGELGAITNQAIEQHLRECHNCDQAYKTHGSLIRAIGNARLLSTQCETVCGELRSCFIKGRCSRGSFLPQFHGIG